MTSEPEILEQLQKINHRLDQLTSSRRIAGSQLMSGIFHSIGLTIGTTLVILIAIYFLSKIDFGQTINDYVQNLLPKPIQINVPFSPPSLDQL